MMTDDGKFVCRVNRLYADNNGYLCVESPTGAVAMVHITWLNARPKRTGMNGTLEVYAHDVFEISAGVYCPGFTTVRMTYDQMLAVKDAAIASTGFVLDKDEFYDRFLSKKLIIS